MNKHKRKGLLLAPDDLEVGKFVAVHSFKRSNDSMRFFGQCAQIKAINFPFVVVWSVGDNEIATIDLRYFNLMPVTEEFVQAQVPKQTVVAQNHPLPNESPEVV